MEEKEEEKPVEDPVTVWSGDEPEEKKETETENPFKSNFDIFRNFTECTTIQCIAYIFLYFQTTFGKIFWAVVMFFMAILGLYWISTAYIDWKNRPVLTTITTTAFSVKQIEFPAVTICSQGMSWSLFTAGILKLFIDYLDRKKQSINLTAYDAGNLFWALDKSLMPSDLEKKKSLQDKITSPIFKEFMHENFPGIDEAMDMINLLMLMISKNPNADVAALAYVDKGYDPCKNDSAESINDQQPPCSEGFVLDSKNNFCYLVEPTLNNIWDGSSVCSDYDAEVLILLNDEQLDGLLALLNAGNLTLPQDSNDYFFMNAIRDSDLQFSFIDRPLNGSFKNIILQPDDKSQFCLVGQYVPKSVTLKAFPSECADPKATICYTSAYVPLNCKDLPKTEATVMDKFLNPDLKGNLTAAVKEIEKHYKQMYQKLNQTDAFRSIFSSLWYGSMPCNELKGLSGIEEGEKANLRYCEWKGMPISCSSIFQAFPTDQGMCCSFNMKAAEEIFRGTTYPNMITKMQKQDKALAFKDPTIPPDYTKKNEPKTSAGRNKGLVLMLDAHSDLFTTVSVDSDYKGFMGLVSSKGNFPFLMLEGFDIRPGHNNLVAITGNRIDADKSLRNIDRSARGCLFPDENDMMYAHNNYSYSNCIFECNLLYAKSKLQEKINSSYSCSPWFFPNPEEKVTICDPWETQDFLEIMHDEVPDETCNYCLPDCSTTIYETSITAVPFQQCELFNFGVSPLCTPDNDMPQPRKFGAKVLDEYAGAYPYPNFIQKYKTNIRKYETNQGIFTKKEEEYDAYENDIAVVQIYFKKSSLLQIGAQPRMTWIDFFATVGGLLGLVLGMGIVSLVELVWLCMRLAARRLELTDWIR